MAPLATRAGRSGRVPGWQPRKAACWVSGRAPFQMWQESTERFPPAVCGKGASVGSEASVRSEACSFTPQPRPVPSKEPGSLVPRKSAGPQGGGVCAGSSSRAVSHLPWPCVCGLVSVASQLDVLRACLSDAGCKCWGSPRSSSPLLFRDNLVVVIGSRSCVAVPGPQ